MHARRSGTIRIISITEARRLALAAQGFANEEAPFGSGKTGALRAVEHLGYVQVDTISVVQRAHHHVLWSRVPAYQPEHLHTLHAEDRALFEYWSHAASYLPMRDFRFSRPLMRSFQSGRMHWADPSLELDGVMRRILLRLRRDGPLQARDVVPEQTVSGGWGSFTKIERRALHELWMQGRVMIASRVGFQKVFDLPERVLPPDIDRRMPTPRERALFRIRQAVRAHGLVREREITHLGSAEDRREVRAALDALLRRGELVEVVVEGHPGQPCVAAPSSVEAPIAAPARRAHILSPFDNLVIQRKRLLWLFGFDYQLECYVPAAKRKVGYFVLPLLFGDSFVGRLDAVADRAAGILRIKTLLLEPQPSPQFSRSRLEEELQRFATFNGCFEVELSTAAAHTARKLPSS